MGRPEEFDDHNDCSREETDVVFEPYASKEDSDVCSMSDAADERMMDLGSAGQAKDASDPYGQQNYGIDPYNGNAHYNDNYYNNNPYSNNPYNNNPHNNGSYHNDPYYNNQYSPLAPPARKNNIPLIIGIAAGIVILFLIAVFALTYRVVSLYSETREKSRNNFEEHEFNDDRQEKRQKSSDEEADSYDYDAYLDDEYGYDDYFDDQYEYGDYFRDDFFYDDYGDGPDFDNDRYYTLHDDIKSDLSYSVEFEYYEYDTDNENVEIMVSYPVISGEKVPNLEHLNSVIAEEIDLFKDYFEEEYAGYMDKENGYFSALSSGYVTYMDEKKLSIAFAEYIYTDYYNEAFLYSINIDMENGIILDNENMLSIDDDFSVEFRKKSDVQNGEIVYLTSMTDQEITEYFNSSNIIVFYTPKGMEIGFNYEEGWVTVTYEEYEKYLKVF